MYEQANVNGGHFRVELKTYQASLRHSLRTLFYCKASN